MDMVVGDHHVVFLDAVGAVLEQHGHRILSAVVSVSELIESARSLQPDACLIGQLPADPDSPDVVRQVLAVSSNTKVIVLAADRSRESMQRALSSGAVGYIHKSRGIAALTDALQRVAQDEIVVDGVIRRSRTRRADPAPLAAATMRLTERERQCLTMLAHGDDTATMARRLGVSTTTVRSHVQAVLTKLGVHSRLAAASMAVRYALVEPVTDMPERYELA
jgi:two-component system nitrate/nitrite response regulator NarL